MALTKRELDLAELVWRWTMDAVAETSAALGISAQKVVNVMSADEDARTNLAEKLERAGF